VTLKSPWISTQRLKLGYRSRTLSNLHVNVVANTCYIFYNIRFSNVSDGWGDLQGQSRSLVVVPFDRSRMISCWSSIITMSVSCTLSERLSLICENIRSRDPEHTPFAFTGVICHVYASTYSPPSMWIPNLKCLCFTRFRYTIGLNNLNVEVRFRWPNRACLVGVW